MKAGDRICQGNILMHHNLNISLRAGDFPEQKTGEDNGEQQEEKRQAKDLGRDGLPEGADPGPDSVPNRRRPVVEPCLPPVHR